MSKSDKRILILYHYFGTTKGSWSTRIYEMSKVWIEKGWKVTVISGIYDKSDIKASKLVEQINVNGIDVRVLRFTLSNYQSFPRRIISFLGYAFMSIWTGMKEKCDVVYVSSGPITVGIPGIVLSKLKGVPMVFEVRDLWPGGAISLGIIKNKVVKKLLWWLEAICYRHARLVVPASKGMENDIKNRFPAVATLVIPNASDLHVFAKKTARPSLFGDQKWFVYFGTLGYIDNCVQILRAATKLKERGRGDIIILIIGDGREKKELQNYSARAGLDNVVFWNSMPKSELVPWVRYATGSILTTLPVPFMDMCSPNKMFDSFAAGTPVIQTTQGWIKDLFEREKCGITVAPNDPGAMADAFELLADNPKLRNEMGQNAYRLANTLFERKHLALKLLDRLEDLVKKTK